MTARVDVGLLRELEEFGAHSIANCFNCGNCTAICPVSAESAKFPRDIIRFAQLGLVGRILASPDIWLCDYCGQCSDTCPRQAEPGEIMMAARRYAISKYDSIGISKRLYTSRLFASAFLGVTSAILLGLIVLLHGPATNHVSIPAFLPFDYMHWAGLILGALVLGCALLNLFSMYRHLGTSADGSANTDSGRLVPRLFKGLKGLVTTVMEEVVAQKSYSECGERDRWFAHMAIVWGFVGLALATTLDLTLNPTGKSVPLTNPIRLLGTVTGILLMYGTGVAVVDRIRKTSKYSAFSTFTDWLFLLLLFSSGLTGFLVEVFMYADLASWTYGFLTLHIVVVFQLLLLAPFTKFAHAIYRPLALWMTELKK